MKGLLVGYGSIGRRHLANFHSLGVQDWAVVHTGKGTLPLEPPVQVRTYTDLDLALREEEPTFAVIVNPTNLHVATAIVCIEADCHVLLEKPVSHTPEGVDALVAAAEAHPVQVLVGFQFRFHPALRRIRELLEAGTIGSPLHARAVWAEHLPSWHPWEDWRGSYAARPELGGGVHHTISHPLDYLRMLFGDATAVLATLRDNGPLGLEVPESADILLRFDEGVEAHLHLDYWCRPATHRVEITCTEGTIHWDYINGEFRVWHADAASWRPESHPGVDDRNELFLSQSRHFLDVVDGRTEPACTLADGVEVVRLCAAIERSAARVEPRSGATQVEAGSS